MSRATLFQSLIGFALLSPAFATAEDADAQIEIAPVEATEQVESQDPPKLSWAQKAKLRYQITSCRQDAGDNSASEDFTIGRPRQSDRNQRHSGVTLKGYTSLENTSWGREQREREAAERAQAGTEASTQEAEDPTLSKMSPKCQQLVRDYEHLVFRSKRR